LAQPDKLITKIAATPASNKLKILDNRLVRISINAILLCHKKLKQKQSKAVLPKFIDFAKNTELIILLGSPKQQTEQPETVTLLSWGTKKLKGKAETISTILYF
jgi:hypothetical protein